MGRKALSRERKNDEAKTKDWIVKLFPYFQKNGLKGVTMDLVAQELDKSKTTVYDYFQTKEQLIELLVDYKLAEIQTFEDIILNESISYTEKCYQTLKHQADHISDISNLFLADLRELYPVLWQKVEKFLDYCVQVMSDFYKKGSLHNEFNVINPTIVAMNDQLFFRTLTNPDFLSNSGLTLQEAFEQYSKLKFFGIIKP
jgi:AcrR family transcriptional regulator